MNERLYRSREDRLIGGVCAGIADRLDLDPTLVRLGWALLTIVTGGAFLIIYIIMLVVVPEEPIGGVPPVAPPPGPGAVPGWQAPGAEQASWQAPTTGESAVPGWQAPVGAAGAAAGPGTEGPTGEAPLPGWQAPGAEQAGWQAPAGAAPLAGAPAPTWTPPDQAYAARRAERAERSRRREGTIGLVFGLLLILLGVWFLFRQYVPDIDLEAFWPIAIIALGALLLIRAFRFDRGGDGT